MTSLTWFSTRHSKFISKKMDTDEQVGFGCMVSKVGIILFLVTSLNLVNYRIQDVPIMKFGTVIFLLSVSNSHLCDTQMIRQVQKLKVNFNLTNVII